MYVVAVTHNSYHTVKQQNPLGNICVDYTPLQEEHGMVLISLPRTLRITMRLVCGSLPLLKSMP